MTDVRAPFGEQIQAERTNLCRSLTYTADVVNGARNAFDSIEEAFVSGLVDFERQISLVQTTLLERGWLEGRNPQCSWDGDHFHLPGTVRPLTVSRVESVFLGNLVAACNANNVLEVGTAFGYSAAWLAYGIGQTSHDGLVFTLDNGSEGGLGDQLLDIARQIWSRVGVTDRIKAMRGTSPEALDELTELVVDIAFIDGEHRGGQPLKDYQACVRRLSPSGSVVFHDAQTKYDVPEAVARAEADGFTIVPLGTSCEMVVALRDKAQVALVENVLAFSKRDLIIKTRFHE